MTDFNPYEERAPVEFERPKQGRLERFLMSIQAVPPSVLVVDLSHYNADGHCDFAKIKASGVAGVILKCSESDWYKDTAFEYSWQAAMDNDLAVMLYHFNRSNKTGEVQFNWFMSCAENFLNYVEGSTAVALDVETVDNTDKDTRASRAFDFCKRVRDAGLKDGIYCSPGLVPTLFPLNDSRWNALTWQWVAHWTSAADYTLPNGWSRNLVKAWQFGIYPTHSWTPKIEGAGNAVDCNHMFFESATALKIWLGQDDGVIPGYPFMVRVIVPVVVREVPDPLGLPLWVASLDTGLTVFDSINDVNDKIWYDVGSGWVLAEHVTAI